MGLFLRADSLPEREGSGPRLVAEETGEGLLQGSFTFQLKHPNKMKVPLEIYFVATCSEICKVCNSRMPIMNIKATSLLKASLQTGPSPSPTPLGLLAGRQRPTHIVAALAGTWMGTGPLGLEPALQCEMLATGTQHHHSPGPTLPPVAGVGARGAGVPESNMQGGCQGSPGRALLVRLGELGRRKLRL